jgi:hypothetical protein
LKVTGNSVSAPRSWRAALFQPVDISSLVFFRLAFAMVALWEVTRYLSQDWVRQIWIEPDFLFGYPFFEWVKPWPGNGMILHFWALGGLAALILLGAFYRLAAGLFFLAFTYVFLLEQSHYLNHFYLVSLISFLLVFLPAHHKLSIDALLRPRLRSETVSSWAVWLLRFQVGVPYFYGGLAKINGDWLQGEPMRYWLQGKGSLPLVGPLLAQPWAPYFFSYGGLLLDLGAVPLLLWRRTRVWAFLVTSLFHVANDAMFQIGIFPWFMIAATTIFFEPDWPRRLLADWGPRPSWRGVLAGFGGALGAVAVLVTQATVRDGLPLVPLLMGATAGALIAWTLSSRLGTREAAAAKKASRKGSAPSPIPSSETSAGRPSPSRALGVSLLVAWAVGQLVVPLRHYFIPGDVNWTEEGHRFSWHMMLRTKQGAIRYEVIDPADGSVWEIDPSSMLTPRQAYTVPGRADMIRQFARHLATEFAARGRPNVEVRALTNVTLNGRQPQPFVNPDVDLTREPARLWGTPWILPLTQPLPGH